MKKVLFVLLKSIVMEGPLGEHQMTYSNVNIFDQGTTYKISQRKQEEG